MKRWQKNVLAFFISLAIVVLLLLGIYIACYEGIEYLDYKTKKDDLEKFEVGDGDFYLKNFSIGTIKYGILKDNDKNINIVLKDKNNILLMETVKQCDTVDGEGIGIHKNKIYIHCLGTDREIIEFEILKASIFKSTRQLNYEKTPNVSGMHLLIEKADKKYLYLYSNVKKNESIAEGDKIKCSLENNQCIYNIEKAKEEKKEDKKEDKKEEKKD